MEKYEVVYSERAARDVSSIAVYIYHQLHAPQAAARIMDAIVKEIDSLECLPMRHALVNNDKLSAMSIRKAPVENYLLFYIVDEESKTVNIITIQYAHRDWENLI